jgi:hypothetical protein
VLSKVEMRFALLIGLIALGVAGLLFMRHGETEQHIATQPTSRSTPHATAARSQNLADPGNVRAESDAANQPERPAAPPSSGVPRPQPDVIRDLIKPSTAVQRAHPNTARSQLAAGNFTEARAQAEAVLATEPANEPMLGVAAEAACALKDETAAQAYYERISARGRPRVSLACQAAGIALKAPAKRPSPGINLRLDGGV